MKIYYFNVVIQSSKGISYAYKQTRHKLENLMDDGYHLSNDDVFFCM